jgi:uncharacterized protein
MQDMAETETASPGSVEVSSDEKTMGLLCHLSPIAIGFLGPLLIWLIKKDTMPFVNDQGKEALNFQITMFIGYIICGALMFVVVGIFLLPILILVNLILMIMGTIAASKGTRYRYPFALRLIK